MKILFLSKRCPMGRDLMLRPYGRFHHIPRLLAEHGHKVTVLLLDYRNCAGPSQLRRDQIDWISHRLSIRTPASYYRAAFQVAREIAPDWIVGVSDTYYGIMAQQVARRLGTRYMIDAYDNYEAYIPWLKPLHWLWRRALGSADLITAAGPQLAELMGRGNGSHTPVVLPMATDRSGFKMMDRTACRKALGLPPKAKLIGYCGGISVNRNIRQLFTAVEYLRARHSDVKLVLSGRIGRGVTIPREAIWLGYVEDSLLPTVLNSFDVLAVVNRDSSFGRYSYPIKLYEAMRCSIPVVVSRTPATSWILARHPALLTTPDNPSDLAEHLNRALGMERIDYGSQPRWEDSVALLEEHLQAISVRRSTP